MSVQNITRRAGPYVGTGLVSAYTFAFKVFRPEDVKVVRSESADASAQDEALKFGTDYTVKLNANQDEKAGGTVTLVSPLAEGLRLSILSAITPDQQMVLTNHDGMLPTTLNDSADKAIALIQELQELLGRGITVPATSGMSPEELLGSLLDAAKDAQFSAEEAKRFAEICEEIKQNIFIYSWDIPHVVDTLDDVEKYPFDGFFAVGGYGDPGHYGQDISNRVVKASGSTKLRTLGERFSDVVNVKDFGAKGDGVTDDTAAIQAALLLSIKPVYFPAGAYVVSKTLNVKDYQSLIGEAGGYMYHSQTYLLFKGEGAKNFSLPWCKSWKVANPDVGAPYLADSSTRGDVYQTLDLTAPFSAAIVLGKGSGISGLGIYPYFDGVDGYAGSDGRLSDAWDVGIWCKNADAWHLRDVICAGHWRKAANLVTASDIGDGKVPACELGRADNCTFVGYRGVAIRSPDDATENNWGLAGTVYSRCLITSIQHQSGHLATSSALAQPFEAPSAFLEVQGGVMRGLHFAFCTFNGRDDIAAIIPKCKELLFTRCYWESRGLRVSGVWKDLIGSRFITSSDSHADFVGMTKYAIDLSPYYKREDSVTRYVASEGVCASGGSVRDDEYMHPRLGTNITNRLTPGGIFRIYDSNFSPVATVNEKGEVSIKGASIDTQSDTLNIKRNRFKQTEAYVLRVYASGNLQFGAGNLSIEGACKPVADAKYSLGHGSLRWSEVFSSTPAITTSDCRAKSGATDPDEALMRAWGKVNFRVFQFKDAVEKKGADARLHVGVIAQQVIDAFASEGLDATRYGLLCYDKWEDEYEDVEVIDVPEVADEEGRIITPQKTHIEHRLVTPAGDRYGIRYEEALALEAAYLRWELQKIKQTQWCA